jgi:DNA-binding response OmpR family regulator
MSALRILVADRERQNADDVSDLLRRWGHDVQVAYDLCHTLSTAMYFEPDLAFLELSLVGMSALRLRRKPGLANTRFVATVDLRQATLSSDLLFGDSLLKPIPPLELLKALVKVRETIEQSWGQVHLARAAVKAAEERTTLSRSLLSMSRQLQERSRNK